MAPNKLGYGAHRLCFFYLGNDLLACSLLWHEPRVQPGGVSMLLPQPSLPAIDTTAYLTQACCCLFCLLSALVFQGWERVLPSFIQTADHILGP